MYWTFGVVLLFLAIRGVLAGDRLYTARQLVHRRSGRIVCSWLFPEHDGSTLGFTLDGGQLLAIPVARRSHRARLLSAAGVPLGRASRRGMASRAGRAATAACRRRHRRADSRHRFADRRNGGYGGASSPTSANTGRNALTEERLSISTGAMLGRIAGTIGKLIVGAAMVAYAIVESFWI
ncbi:MAG: hypothetical protein U0992_09450 [Planctomycetaceae bacterium]